MQLMSWTIARLGSRFNLLFEPYRRRVMHSAMGRFLDEPLDLQVGLIEPDGTRRILPFSEHGELLMNCEQFDRINSITFRGYSEKYLLRFELNIHSVFYPQNERLCLMPAFYVEMRVNPVDRVRWTKPKGPRPDKVTLFICLRRPDTQITVHADDDGNRPRIDLAYRNELTPRDTGSHPSKMDADQSPLPPVEVRERLISLNPECCVSEDGAGLTCELPVTPSGSGVKWRLVWAAHVDEPVLKVRDDHAVHDAHFRYRRYWSNIDEVSREAIATRDDRLAHSRRFEKVIDQAPLDTAQRHLLNESFQAWLSNTFWCEYTPASTGTEVPVPRDWFSVWEGSCFFHSTIDVEYNVSLLYLTLWPKLLKMQLQQWAYHETSHAPSEGGFLSHDMGQGADATQQAYPHPMEVEENCNYLLLLQAYTRWTGDREPARTHADLVTRLAAYLLWSDADHSGFPSRGVANTIDDASPAVQFARKQTYLAVKRLCALRAAADLLMPPAPQPPDSEPEMGSAQDAGADPYDGDERAQLARRLDAAVKADLPKVERQAWLGDHYAVCVDRSAIGLNDVWTDKPLPFSNVEGWDGYSIYTGNGLLLPVMIGQPPLLDLDRLRKDIYAAARENLGRYGCGHTSSEPQNVWISQNLWRDMLARYMKLHSATFAPLYWDMQVMSNTGQQSLGFIDTYINNYLCFYPRGIASIGYLLASPRLVIDRLAPGGSYITVDPDRDAPQRWPLLALADWKAGKIPVCVVDEEGRASIEGEIDPIIIYGGESDPEALTAGGAVIG